MKKIGIFTDGWKRLITYAWTIGIEEEIARHKEEVSVYQFNCFGNWSEDKYYNDGEYSIFRLPDMESFDGVILDATNITDEATLNLLLARIKEANVPAVSLGRQIEGILYAGVDNYHTISHLMEHLYYIHDCRTFAYAGGPADNSDNMEREAAYRDFLKDKRLSVEKNPVWSGLYTFDTGRFYFDELMKNKLPVPDAIVCGNDHIATGVIVAARKYGYEVPRDFLVTGFDNIEQSKFFKPHLTTVEQIREEIGAAAMKMLFDIWDGNNAGNEVLVENKCVFSQSCGCVEEDTVNYPFYVDQFIASNMEQRQLEEDLANYQINLFSAETFQRIFDVTQEYILSQNCHGFSLVLDERLLALHPLDIFPVSCYEDKYLTVVRHVVDDKVIDNPSPSEFLNLMSGGSDKHLMFSPIHLRDKCLGFIVLRDGKALFDTALYCNMLSYLSQALIRLYHAQALAQENDKLEYLYKHDQLTSVYNRIAFRMMAEKYISYLHETNTPCMLAFVDADHFKEINDTYGHDRGDEVLIQIAGTLKNQCPKSGTVYRQGGDEFIVMFGAPSEEVVYAYKERVQAELAKDGISVSMGHVLTIPGEPIVLEELLKQADSKMYEIKKSRK